MPNEIAIKKTFKTSELFTMITYDNITLVPKRKSHVPSRSKCDTSIKLFGHTYSMPMIASPMPDVCNGKMAMTLMDLNVLGIIHRFQSIEEQADEFESARWAPSMNREDSPGCAIGVSGDFTERFMGLARQGCRIFCLDTANGFNDTVGKAISQVRMMWSTFKESQTERIYLIAGNVATVEGYEYLTELEVDAVRVGMAGGSVCETKTETGIYLPTPESIRRIVEWKLNRDIFKYPNIPLIIADGGIREPSDMNKALALGADVVMCGSKFAGTEESPGQVVALKTGKVKLYRGAASYSVQQETGKEPLYNEGRETFVPYVGKVEKVIDRFHGGLQSAMSMADALILKDFPDGVTVEML